MDSAARDRLLALPTAGLGHWPTPFHRADRFGEAVGAEVWIKRDDVQGVALAGNKIRKFDLVIGQALVDGCDTLVTTGAAQSNSARTGAASAAAVGMDSVLVLSGHEPAEPSGNLLLDHLVGSEIRFAGDVDWVTLNATVDAVVADLDAEGRSAFAAPVGCSSPLGTLGFARAFLELQGQLDDAGVAPAAIVHASTSGGTHAGLLLGRSIAGIAPDQLPIVAVDVGAILGDPGVELLALAREAGAIVGHDLTLTADEVRVVTDQLGDGYGRHTAAARSAINLLARTEAVVCDPVYSGKGLAGLVAFIEQGVAGPVVFWHTGGYHALFDPRHGARHLG
ncbi:MAG: pyridoxal-phosphate dependent enzyme [Actinomycetota bacterium]